MRTLTVLVLALVASSLALSQEEVIRIPGEVHFASAETQRAIYYNSPVTLNSQPPAGIKLPEWAGKDCRFGTLKLGRPLQQWRFVIAPGTLRAVVDANRNNDLTDDPVLIGTSRELWEQTYAPVRLTVSLDGALCTRYFGILYSNGRAYLYSNDLRRFNGMVNGQPFQLTVIDGNADGAFDTPSQSRWDGDRCYLSAGDANAPRQEVPVPRLYRAGDRYYRLKVLPDGSVCELRPSDLTIATVKINYPNVNLTLIGKEVGFWEARTTNGVLQLPADEYTITEYSILTKDAQGVEWDMRVAIGGEMKLRVNSLAEASLRLPDNLVASLGVGSRVKQDTLDISLVLQPAGQRFHQVTGISRNGDLPPPPTLRIVDRTGRTIKVEKFHYG